VCYEMLTGDPPHVGSSAQQVIMKIITEQPQEVTTHRKSVPANVAAAVGKALEKLPADRFESAAKFAEALESPSFTVGASGAQAVAAVSDLRRLRLVAMAASAVAVLALMLAGWFAMRGPTGAADVALITLLPPEGESFSARSSFGALSPDGRKFAFVTLSARGERRIWIRSLDSLESVPVEGTSGAEAPFWSPDGKSLAFFVGDRLNRLELGTAVSRALCAAPSADAGSWGDDGTIVFTTVRGVERVHADGGPCTVAIPSDSGGRFRHPSLFAGGKKVLFEFRGGPLLNQEVRVGDLESGQQTLLLESGISPSWIAPGYIVYGLIGQDGASGIYAQRLSRNGEAVRGEAVALTGSVRTANNIFAYSASASGALAFLPGFGDREKLLVSRSGEIVDTVRQRGAWTHRFAHTRPLVALNGRSALWAYDIGVGVSTALARDLTPLTSAYPVWAPGDTALVSGYGALQMISVGSRDVQPLPIPQSAGIHATDWSSDGRLLILEDAEGLATFDFASGRITRIAGLANATEGVLSPDMRWISYVSQETGALEVFVAPWGRGGSTTRVSRASGRTPRWRGDGRELFFVTAEGGVTSVPFPVGGAPTLNADALRQTLLFRAPGWSRPFHADIGHFYDASPDGQRFVLRTSASASYAVLMKNWPTMMGIR
jgi:eukaryotic-like serine/threonine-protein kinase